METKKKKSLASRIPSKVWLLISFWLLLLVWYLLSIIPQTSRGFPNVVVTIQGLITMIQRGVFWQDISSSLISVLLWIRPGLCHRPAGGHSYGLVSAGAQHLDPWIQFIRNIPPLAYVPLIVIVSAWDGGPRSSSLPSPAS